MGGMGGGILDRLAEVLDELAGVDPDTLDDTTLHDTVVALGGQDIRLEALWCRLIGVWDRRRVWADNGSKAPGARLARGTHLRRGDADVLVRRARDLHTMPETAAAYSAGEVNGRHVDLIASCDREWRNNTFVESEELLVNLCRTAWFGNAVRGIEYWKLLADRDADDGANPTRDGRHLSVSTGWAGEVVINGVLDPVGGAIFTTELDRICEQLRLQDLGDGTLRTVTQRRADALVEMAMRAATAPADGLRPRPLFSVTIGIDRFAWMCQTAAGTVIAPNLLIPLLSDADIERIVYDPLNRRIEASRRQRFTGAVRRIIEIRGQHCQHPCGCDEPAARCDTDHIVPRADGGITCLCNGQLLCAHHNRTIKANHDHNTRTHTAPAPRPPTADPHPCPFDHQPTWTATDSHDQIADPSRAPPAAGWNPSVADDGVRSELRSEFAGAGVTLLAVSKADITAALVERLVASQFPQWAHLPIVPVEVDGWDNSTFRLGDDLSVRLPSADGYIAQVDKEHRWLPVLGAALPIPIPQPVAAGRPGAGFNRPWSIYTWLAGEPATSERIVDLRRFATDLADFLGALQAIDATAGPAAGSHSAFRGGPLRTYDVETRRAISELGDVFDVGATVAVWEAALAAEWHGPARWVHGDVTPANLLVTDGRLSAVIDFGCAAVGDPACDLVMAWTFFDDEIREAFRHRLPLDHGTWARARGWALWKALITMVEHRSRPADVDAATRRFGWRLGANPVIDEILVDHQRST